MSRSRAAAIVLTAAAAVLAVPACAWAQTIAPRGVRMTSLGVFVGMARTSFGPNQADASFEISPRYGLTFGATVTGAPNTVTYEVNVVLTMKGGRVSNTGSELPVRLTYLEFPVLARINLLASHRRRPFLNAGITPSARLAGRGTTGYDIGATIGGGLDWHHVVLGARYTYGLTKTGFSVAGAPLRNRSLALTIGMTTR